MRFVALALATSAGVGYIPFAPGTFGSLAGLLLWWAIPSDVSFQLPLIAVIFVAGSWSGSIAERHFATTDPGPVVIDDVLGMLVTLFLNPATCVGPLLRFLLLSLLAIVPP